MYTDTFGGGTINPSQRTHIALTTAVSVTLSWPIEQQIGGDNIVADIMDINATDTGVNIDFPDARQVSEGYTSLFNNVGSNTFTVRDSAGGTIQAVLAGEAWFIYLTDNSTEAGTWRTFELGASVSVASAGALAGAGIKAISTTLNQRAVVDSIGATPTTIVDGDRAILKIWTGGAGTFNLTAAGTVGTDWFFMVRNSGSGDLTVTPPGGTIDGGASLVVAIGQSAIIITDGTNYFTVGFGQATSSTFDYISIAIGGTGDYTLAGAELNRITYNFTGILTGNRSIVVPAATEQYWVDNSTTGAFTLDIKVAGQGSPPQIASGESAIFYCDGTIVVAADTTSIAFPITVAQGGTGATDAGTARTNLAVPPTSRLVVAGTGLTGGGDLSSDKTLNVIGGLGITANANDVAVTPGAGIVVSSGSVVLDFSGLTNRAIAATAATDSMVFNNAGVSEQIDFQDMGIRVVSLSTAQTFALGDANTHQVLTGTTNREWDVPTNAAVAFGIGAVILMTARDFPAEITIDPNAPAVLTSIFATGSATSRTVISGGTACLIKIATDEWSLFGDIA